MKELAKSANSFPHVWEILMPSCLAFFCSLCFPSYESELRLGEEILVGFIVWLRMVGIETKFLVLLTEKGPEMLTNDSSVEKTIILSKIAISVPLFWFCLWFSPRVSKLHNSTPKPSWFLQLGPYFVVFESLKFPLYSDMTRKLETWTCFSPLVFS